MRLRVICISAFVWLLAAAPASAATRTLIPAYFSSPSLWRQADAAGRDGVLIVNPASGPGSQPLASWRRVIADARSRHVTLLGYVATGYGDDPLARIKRQIGRYRRWYGLRGIFFDEVSDSASRLTRYGQIVRSAHRQGVRTVALNPGVVPARGYFGLADIVVTFESPLEQFGQAAAPAWLTQIPARKIANIVIGVKRDMAASVIAEAQDRGAGLVFVTDDDLPNPYDTLPGYFAQELAWLR